MKKLIFGIVLLVIGVFVVPVAAILMAFSIWPDSTQFIVPGTAQVSVEEPGRYYLWNDYQTVFEGKSYINSSRIPDGFDITIKDADTDEELDFVPDLSTSSSSGSSAKNSIGYVEVAGPTDISIEVAGGNGERVFSFSKSFVLLLVGMIFAALFLAFIFGLSGLGLTIWGGISLIRKRKATE